MKLPSKLQWRQLFKVLNKKEKNIFLSLSFLLISSFLFLSFSFYFKNTEIKPAKGGVYIEGVVSSPRFINPVYAASSDVDRDLTQLIYSGLMKYDGEGNLQPDLTKEYQVSEEGKVYEFSLKENLLWSDGKPLTADDVVFTIKTIQNPSIKSPLRASWLGVTAEKTSSLSVRFELKNSSAVFLENCTLKIIPQHIWQDVSFQNFPLSIYNLKPLGSGPYQLKDITQDKAGVVKSLELTVNPNYYGSKPNIPQIVFHFFSTYDELIKSINSDKIKGFSVSDLEQYQDSKLNKNFSEYSLSLPRYFAVFFNPTKSKPLNEENIRKALNYATNKQEIIEKVLLNFGQVVDSPTLPNIYQLEEPTNIYQFDETLAKELLEKAGFTENENGIREKTVKKDPAFQFKSNLKVGSQGSEVQELQKCLAKDPAVYPEAEITGYFGAKTKTAVIKFQEKYRTEILDPQNLKTGTGDVLGSTRTKLNELCAPASQETLSLSFSLITVNQPILVKVASLLKEQWKAIGVDLEIKTMDISSLEEEIIRPRAYEMILFGEVLTMTPDLYPFWHSSQIKDPGLNLAIYENKEADKLLEGIRQSSDKEERKTGLEKLQNVLIASSPAVFLYTPDYLYLTSKEIKGIDTTIITDPSKRFSEIEKWYIKTKRVWK